jgi:hypothetical protein
MIRTETDAQKHGLLVSELIALFKDNQYSLLAAIGNGDLPSPNALHNDGYGDQEDKAPDVLAYDSARNRMVIGEAKTGDGDFETEHALTQYNVFLDQFDATSHEQALLYIIVPASRVPEFNTLITHYIHREYWSNIILVSSKAASE